MTDTSKSQACYVKALSEMKNAGFDKENPHFHSKYATYAAGRAATNEALAKNGLGLSERVTVIDGIFTLISEIRHTSGDIVNRSDFPLSIDAKIQQKGSEITYARRYNRQMLCGISSGEEDDGNDAQNIEEKKQPFKPKDGEYHELAITVFADRINSPEWLKDFIVDEIGLAKNDKDRNARDVYTASRYAPPKGCECVGSVYLLNQISPELYAAMKTEVGKLFHPEDE